MGAYYETIPPSLNGWIMAQKMLWVATAPLSGSGHVNVSPKGGPYFGIVDQRTFWYLDLTGSGNETVSHLHEPGNGRITIMFNAFEGPPKIVRLWGTGRALELGTKEFDAFKEANGVELLPGSRSIIVVDIHQVGSSCGWSVPFYEFKTHRQVLNDAWVQKEKKFKSGSEKDSMPRYVYLIYTYLSSTDAWAGTGIRRYMLTPCQVLGLQERVEHGRPSGHENRRRDGKEGEDCAHQEDGRSLCAKAIREPWKLQQRACYPRCAA